MSGITKLFGGVACFFLFPSLAQAVTVTPQAVDVSLEPSGSVDFSIDIKHQEEEGRSFKVELMSVEIGSGPDDLVFLPLRSGISVSTNDLHSEIAIAPDEIRSLPMTISIDETFPSGVQVIAVQVYEVAEADDSVAISTGSMTLVFVTVGEVEESAELLDYSSSSGSHLPMSFHVAMRNTGESVIQPDGSVIIENIFGKEVERLDINPKEKRIPADQDRSFVVYWGDWNSRLEENVGFFRELSFEITHFRPGVYKARLWVTTSAEGEIFTDSIRVVLFPWRTIVVFFGILVVLAGGVWITRKK